MPWLKPGENRVWVVRSCPRPYSRATLSPFRFTEIVQYYMDNNEYSNILATCKKYRSAHAAQYCQACNAAHDLTSP